MRVLLSGAQGQVGRALAALQPASVELHALTHRDLDICDAAAVRATLQRLAPDWIINAGAYTAVDRAETEPALAEAVNAMGPAHLALAARSMPSCRLLQISTDYVFDGRSRAPYRPQDPTHPMSVYGRTKLQGEQAVKRILADRALILRTAWVYAPQGHNFLLTMLRLMRERGEVRVVADQFGSPTAAQSVARAVWAALARPLPPEAHILHWTDAGSCSWFDFAQLIAQGGLAAGLLDRPARVTPITTAEYPTAAQRPAYSVLELAETAAALELAPFPWADSLQATLQALRPGT
ncbi:MAG TPA: dTDP-4-dehydrorhamnose reductase [Steroidobacteraceae bacterium]|jgi:dTDP-4-dehydrorhamnose reductase|nr:dTDP-4-dehydrorhamnose reductase [Steroidobacteraceae bacterium]